MTSGERSWTVSFGGDVVHVARTPAGLVAVSIPSRREVIGDRAEVTELRDVLDAALADEGEPG